MTDKSLDTFSDAQLHCRIIKDITPERKFRDKLFLCECSGCGKTFVRSSVYSLCDDFIRSYKNSAGIQVAVFRLF